MELGQLKQLRLSELPPSIKPEMDCSDLSYNTKKCCLGVNHKPNKHTMKINQRLTPEEVMEDDTKIPSYAFNQFKQQLPSASYNTNSSSLLSPCS
jgi:hypothetical protein